MADRTSAMGASCHSDDVGYLLRRSIESATQRTFDSGSPFTFTQARGTKRLEGLSTAEALTAKVARTSLF